MMYQMTREKKQEALEHTRYNPKKALQMGLIDQDEYMELVEERGNRWGEGK